MKSPDHADTGGHCQHSAFCTFTAFSGWYVFVFFSPYSVSGSYLGLALVLAASACAAKHLWPDLRKEPIFWVSLLLGGYILLRSIMAISQFPELDEMRNPHWRHFVIISLPIPLVMGWWLFRYPHHIKPLLIVSVIGFLVGVIYEAPTVTLREIDLSSRFAWGYHPNFLGLTAGAGMLACFSYLLMGSKKNVIEILSLTTLIILFGLMVVTSQSRSIWLALPIALAVLIYSALINRQQSRKVIFSATSGLLLLPILAMIVDHMSGDQSIIISRILSEDHTLSLLFSGELEAAASQGQSIGARIQMWMIAAEAIWERPLTGWGGGSGEILLTELPYRHFHNFYIELLTSYGVLGVGGFLTLITLMLRALFAAGRTGVITPTMRLSIFCITLFAAIVLNFEIRIGQAEGRALLLLLLSFYAFVIFSNNTPQKAKVPEPPKRSTQP